MSKHLLATQVEIPRIRAVVLLAVTAFHSPFQALIHSTDSQRTRFCVCSLTPFLTDPDILDQQVERNFVQFILLKHSGLSNDFSC